MRRHAGFSLARASYNYRDLAARVGFPCRFVDAIFFSSFSFIDLYISLEAPLNEEVFCSPLFAANAAPAAICCLCDFAGISNETALTAGLLVQSIQEDAGREIPFHF